MRYYNSRVLPVDRWPCNNCAEKDRDCGRKGPDCELRVSIAESCIEKHKVGNLARALTANNMRVHIKSADYWEIVVS